MIVHLIGHKNGYFHIIFGSLFICLLVCLVFFGQGCERRTEIAGKACVIVICRFLRRLSSTYSFVCKLKETHRKLKEIAIDYSCMIIGYP